MRRVACIVLLTATVACGRANVAGLGSLSGGGGAADADPTQLSDADGLDAGRNGFDVRPNVPEAGLPDRFTPPPLVDAGPPTACRIDRDCWSRLGTPFCPGGARGDWDCQRGQCQMLCPGGCNTDCECPFSESCLNGQCQVANRPNLCCFNPNCPPGSTCEWPNGQTDICGAPPPPRDGGPPPLPDAGPFPNDGGPPPPWDGGLACFGDCDCPFSLACEQGQCLPLSSRRNRCCNSPFCPPGDTCVQPNGQPDTCGGSTVPVGAACMAQPDCAGGFCIDESQGFQDGYCTQQCGGGVTCPGDGVCRRFDRNNVLCLDGCQGNADCRNGYSCIQLGIQPERVCWPTSGGSTNPMGDPVGSGCADDDDCFQGLTCLPDQGRGGWSGGYCTVSNCDPLTNPCPGGSQCYAFPGLYSLCLAECPQAGTRSTCRNDYYCLGPTGQSGVCIGN